MIRQVLLGFSLFTTAWLQAQGRTDSLLQPATLPQIISYALEHQPSIRQAAIDEQLTQYAIRNKLADWYPQIGSTFSFQHLFQRSTSFINGVPSPAGVFNTSTVQVYLDQAIFNRDVLLARRTRRDVGLRVSQSTSIRKIDLTADVSKAFYDVLSTRQQIQVAAENISRLEKSLNDAYFRYQAGVTDKTDYKRAQITLNNTTATKQINEAALTAKLQYLKLLMGYPPFAPLVIVYDSLQ